MRRKIYFNSPHMVGRRRDLRSRTTKYEDLLWERIRNRKLGYKFKRQYSIGNYVLDFYCTDLNLGIELDGQWHKNNFEYDKFREIYLSAGGVKVLKFWNTELTKEIDNVIEKIKFNLKPSPEAARLPAGQGEGGAAG